MRVGTIASQKYFNRLASEKQTNAFKKAASVFDDIGTLAFGQMQFITNEKLKNYNWEVLDRFIDFAEASELNAHYNTVINNKHSFPEWYWKLSTSQKLKTLETHTRRVVRKYKDKFLVYKLVNEMVRDEEEDFLGTGRARTKILAELFTWAKDESPNSLFMINDFGVVVRKDMRKAYIQMVSQVLEQGAQIDIVGIQAHLGHPSPYKNPVFQLPSDEEIHGALEEIYSSLKLPIYITEFDLSFDNRPKSPYPGSSINPKVVFEDTEGKKFASWYEYQKYAYRHFYDLCKSKKFVECLVFWRLSDGDVSREGRPEGGFFTEDFQLKRVYEGMKDIFRKKKVFTKQI